MQLCLVLGVKLKHMNSNLFSETEQHLWRKESPQAPRNLHNVGPSVSLCLQPEAPRNFLGDWSSYPASVQGRSLPPQKYGFNEALLRPYFFGGWHSRGGRLTSQCDRDWYCRRWSMQKMQATFSKKLSIWKAHIKDMPHIGETLVPVISFQKSLLHILQHEGVQNSTSWDVGVCRLHMMGPEVSRFAEFFPTFDQRWFTWRDSGTPFSERDQNIFWKDSGLGLGFLGLLL